MTRHLLNTDTQTHIRHTHRHTGAYLWARGRVYARPYKHNWQTLASGYYYRAINRFRRHNILVGSLLRLWWSISLSWNHVTAYIILAVLNEVKIRKHRRTRASVYDSTRIVWQVTTLVACYERHVDVTRLVDLAKGFNSTILEGNGANTAWTS